MESPEYNKINNKYKLLYWNVQGLGGKINEIRSYLNEFEIIILSETWVEEENNEQNLENILPKEYEWKWTKGTRSTVKGRAKGGNLMGIRKTSEWRNFWDNAEKCITAAEVKIDKEWWKIVGVYNRSGLSDIKPHLEELLENNKNMKC